MHLHLLLSEYLSYALHYLNNFFVSSQIDIPQQKYNSTKSGGNFKKFAFN